MAQKAGSKAEQAGRLCCNACGFPISVTQGQDLPPCGNCGRGDTTEWDACRGG